MSEKIYSFFSNSQLERNSAELRIGSGITFTSQVGPFIAIISPVEAAGVCKHPIYVNLKIVLKKVRRKNA